MLKYLVDWSRKMQPSDYATSVVVDLRSTNRHYTTRLRRRVYIYGYESYSEMFLKLLMEANVSKCFI